ncbi:hypothetical protein D3C86_1199300 [compost metagenome]
MFIQLQCAGAEQVAEAESQLIIHYVLWRMHCPVQHPDLVTSRVGCNYMSLFTAHGVEMNFQPRQIARVGE